jgi:putative endonuclease
VNRLRETLAQRVGRSAERHAERHLRAAGLETLARNWHCRGGELDLVMRDGSELVFVEVRRRKQGAFGGGLESIDAGKRRRLIHAAETYLARERCVPPCRIDVVAIDEIDGTLHIEWIRNAIDASA